MGESVQRGNLMTFEIKLRQEYYSNIETATEIMTVDTITYEYGCVVIGNYYIPLNAFIYIKNLG